MKLALKIVLIILALLLVAILVFVGIYFTRLQTISSIEKLTNYEDGYNLYCMEVKYDYNIDNVINYGLHNNQDVTNAILKECLPLIPVDVKTPEYGCTAFTLTDSEGNVHMGRNYDFKNDTSAMLVYCNPKDGYKSIAFAALDNIDANEPEDEISEKLSCLTAPFICLDGVNEKGLSIAVLTLDSEPAHQETGKPIIATSIVIRLVLDRAATTQEAVDLLKGYDMLATSGRDYHFYITDATGDGRVVEYDCESPTRELVATPISAITNFYGMYIDNVLPNQKNGIYGHGKERYDAVMEVLEQQKGKYNDATVWAGLRAAAQDPNPEDITSNTQWSIDYDNTNLTADIAIRRRWADVMHFELKK